MEGSLGVKFLHSLRNLFKKKAFCNNICFIRKNLGTALNYISMVGYEPV
jgi:hypothetical protein